MRRRLTPPKPEPTAEELEAKRQARLEYMREWHRKRREADPEGAKAYRRAWESTEAGQASLKASRRRDNEKQRKLRRLRAQEQWKSQD